MRLGIMQPYFFPYLGYFDLVYRTDRWIVFDLVQYIRHGWMNRNRILHPRQGWQYFVAPLKKHPRNTLIRDIEVKVGDDWRQKIIAQLGHYRRRAPYFGQTVELVRECLSIQEHGLSRLNSGILSLVCKYLGIPFHATHFSDLNLALPEVNAPGDWALEISKALGATEYLNPPGGAELFDPGSFGQAGIRLTIQDYTPLVYECPGYTFEPNLSIIDVMMWLPPERVLEHLATRERS